MEGRRHSYWIAVSEVIVTPNEVARRLEVTGLRAAGRFRVQSRSRDAARTLA